MAFALSLLSLSLLSAIQLSYAGPVLHKPVKLVSVPVKAFQAASADVVTKNFVPLTKRTSTSSTHSTHEAFRRGLSLSDLHSSDKRQSIPLASLGGIEYLVDITFGTQPVKVIFDTGSSDSWLIQKGFKCVDMFGNPRPAAACHFGPVYTGTIAQTPNENFRISYGDLEFVTGIIGTQDVTIAGIKVPKQTVALGTTAYWRGNGITSGLLGLAYPAITSAFPGTDPSKDKPSNRLQYDPIFTTMYKKKLSNPTFSLVIQRDGSKVGGYVAFGGLPPTVTPSGPFASTPIQVLTAAGGSADTFYTITPDALVYKGGATTNSAQFIVDSGTSLTYIPTAIMQAVAGLFSPKATYDSSQGAYLVTCTATAPSFGFKIGGTTFTLSPKDLILQSQKDTATGKCLLGIVDGGAKGPYILGDTFLSNVVAVFDVGAAQMRFAAHNY
ncbi:aspartic peptidase domain-containing protein [Venturia nashicola]|uniref:Aspartic peptidase domain-containing protein n=1 Tax=Venturia nashicola TaxID=86259 RepID=A0A4Z1NET8_9PEZI|nr:aspartic peptidase domain-containing protein [Venturia nashicola]